jgi:hypothetical protein
MHQPRSDRTARAMKLGALALALLGLFLAGTVALLCYAIYADAHSLALLALGLCSLTFILFIAYRILAARARCPLCHGPILGGSGAQRNRRAKRTLGSHRLRVARNILLTNTFVCPYCNEPTLCRAKPRPKHSQSSRRRSTYRR